MSFDILSLIIDVAILGSLGYTIYFALRLSKNLNNFKNSRTELRNLIDNLSQNILKAETAIKSLKENSHETADELRMLIRESKKMTQELELMNEAGNSLAKRLEGLAEKSSRSVSKQKAPVDLTDWIGGEDDDMFVDREFAEDQDSDDDFFAIKDREYGAEDETFASQDNFQSEAERDLYQALRGKKKMGGF